MGRRSRKQDRIDSDRYIEALRGSAAYRHDLATGWRQDSSWLARRMYRTLPNLFDFYATAEEREQGIPRGWLTGRDPFSWSVTLPPEPRAITQETIERMREQGASDDLLQYAERIMAKETPPRSWRGRVIGWFR